MATRASGKGGANPLGSLTPPFGTLLAEQEERGGGESPEALAIDAVRLLGSDLAGHRMRGRDARGPNR